MMRQNRLFDLVVAVLALMVSFPATTAVAQGKQVIPVSSVDELYAAISDPGNAGVRIVVAEPARFFEVPIVPPLRENLEFIP